MAAGLFAVPEMGKAEMADENEQDPIDAGAQQLLETDDDQRETQNPEKSETDTTDWKAEAEKWKEMSRRTEKAAKTQAERLKEYEDKDKTELERLTERASAAERQAATATSKANAMRIAMEKAPEHATLAQVRAVAKRVRGDDDADLEKDAAELFEMLAPEPKKSATPGKPREKLRGGSEPDEEPEESDGRKLAARIPRSTII